MRVAALLLLAACASADEDRTADQPPELRRVALAFTRARDGAPADLDGDGRDELRSRREADGTRVVEIIDAQGSVRASGRFGDGAVGAIDGDGDGWPETTRGVAGAADAEGCPAEVSFPWILHEPGDRHLAGTGIRVLVGEGGRCSPARAGRLERALLCALERSQTQLARVNPAFAMALALTLAGTPGAIHVACSDRCARRYAVTVAAAWAGDDSLVAFGAQEVDDLDDAALCGLALHELLHVAGEALDPELHDAGTDAVYACGRWIASGDPADCRGCALPGLADACR